MSKRIYIEEKKNGWTVRVEGFMKFTGDYVYKSTEHLALVEFVGELIADRRVKVEER